MEKTIGEVGIDTIRLNHFLNIPAIFNDSINGLLSVYHLPDPSQDPNIVVTKSILNKISINGPGFKYSYGNHYVGSKKEAFAYIDLYANNGDGDNLTGLKIKDVWEKLDDAGNYLYKNYGIELEYDFYSINVANMEINVTIPLSCNYSEYSKILDLIRNASNKKEIKDICEKDDDGNFQTMHRVLGPKSTAPIVMYNKTQNQKKKKEQNHPEAPVPQCDTLRYEMRLNKMNTFFYFYTNNAIPLSLDTKQIPLYMLDDQGIHDFFTQHTKDITNKINAALQSRQAISNVKDFIKKNKKAFTGSSVTFDELCECNATQTVEGILHSIALEIGYQSYIPYVRLCLHAIAEADATEPLLLDITELLSVINNATWIRSECKQDLCTLFLQECENNQNFRKRFCGQRSLLDEVIAGLTSPHPQTIECI